MKKNYQAPSMKTKALYDKDVMAIVPTSDGYQQGVTGGDGVDDEARSPIF
ncbi:MAG: hypothetical protein IKQ77_03725 [Prevotella sp.]|nr:hypothetical protein [Prevotella sp.]